MEAKKEFKKNWQWISLPVFINIFL
jgi:hypothetical protein